jgi:hypothetical protein
MQQVLKKQLFLNKRKGGRSNHTVHGVAWPHVLEHLRAKVFWVDVVGVHSALQENKLPKVAQRTELKTWESVNELVTDETELTCSFAVASTLHCARQP